MGSIEDKLIDAKSKKGVCRGTDKRDHLEDNN